MNEIRVWGELSSFILNTLGLYTHGLVDPSRVNGMWCKRIVKEGLCTFEELDEYLRYLDKEINDPNKYEYCMAPFPEMGDRDIVAIVKDDIYDQNYRLYRE